MGASPVSGLTQGTRLCVEQEMLGAPVFQRRNSTHQGMNATLLAAVEWRQSSVHPFFTRRIDDGDHGHGNSQAEPRKFCDYAI
jgi:hypothetical protein